MQTACQTTVTNFVWLKDIIIIIIIIIKGLKCVANNYSNCSNFVCLNPLNDNNSNGNMVVIIITIIII